MALHKLPLLRRLAIPLLRRVNLGDVTIKHHWTGDPLRLHSFKHKGYWYFGKRREWQNMQRFAELLGPGDRVIDVGGHIGYLSLYFSKLVGPSGHVYTLEPGANNLVYTRANLAGKNNVTLVEKGVGAENGQLTFHLEDHSGQGNSFLGDFLQWSGAEEYQCCTIESYARSVDVVTLDALTAEKDFRPDFIKVDVEGFEWEVLQGAKNVLQTMRPKLMLEVQRRHVEVVDLLQQCGYLVFSADGDRIENDHQLPGKEGDIFCLHATDHEAGIRHFRAA